MTPVKKKLTREEALSKSILIFYGEFKQCIMKI